VDLRNALLQLGAVIESPVRDGLPITLRGKLDLANEVTVDGSMSSQFTSALMMIGSVIEGGLRLNLSGTPVSRAYIDLTADVMGRFGVQVVIEENSVLVNGLSIRACDLVVEADASSASYPLAAAAISGGSVEVLGLGDTSHQSDALTVCCFADSRSEITGVGFIRNKESNRIEGLADQLNRFGAHVTPTPDGLIIDPSELHGAIIDPMHDHRIAMALALVGLRVSGVEISDSGVVSKSWPDYWSVLDAL
jgi:3-phosphoshikimate 1-carboxyvinyltransferase